jgi:hypothetical protein
MTNGAVNSDALLYVSLTPTFGIALPDNHWPASQVLGSKRLFSLLGKGVLAVNEYPNRFAASISEPPCTRTYMMLWARTTVRGEPVDLTERDENGCF